MSARDFYTELQMGAWNTASDESIFDADYAALDSHERQDAAYDIEQGHAAFMLDCGHALPKDSRERLRVAGEGTEYFCGICSRWVKAAR